MKIRNLIVASANVEVERNVLRILEELNFKWSAGQRPTKYTAGEGKRVLHLSLNSKTISCNQGGSLESSKQYFSEGTFQTVKVI